MKKRNTDVLDNFFYKTSKIIVFVPIAIFIAALILRLTQTSKTIGTMVNSITPTPTLTAKKTGIDLKGPYICIYKDSNAEFKAYVKNRKVAATVTQAGKTDKYLLDGDCVRINGAKTCGVSFYVTIAEGMLNGNINGLEQMYGKYAKGKVDLKKAIDSCAKKDFADTVFRQ